MAWVRILAGQIKKWFYFGLIYQDFYDKMICRDLFLHDSLHKISIIYVLPRRTVLCCTVHCSDDQISSVQCSAVWREGLQTSSTEDITVIHQSFAILSTELHCNTLYWTPQNCTALHCAILNWTALQCTALLRNELLHTTALCYTAQHYTVL